MTPAELAGFYVNAFALALSVGLLVEFSKGGRPS